jgi:predicted DCC family thiol-disulfide oxidoreductase YuxK
MLNGESDYKPKNPVIFFDGICNLCNGFIRFIINRDKRAIFRFGLLQSDKVQELLKTFGPPPFHLSTVVLLDGNQVYTESDAILKILGQLNRHSIFLYCLSTIPKFIRDAVYGFISRNRYRFFGRTESCMIPAQVSEDRFI